MILSYIPLINNNMIYTFVVGLVSGFISGFIVGFVSGYSYSSIISFNYLDYLDYSIIVFDELKGYIQPLKSNTILKTINIS